MIEKNKYVIGDNLKLLNKLDNESFQLCYIDPPYNTGRDFDDFNFWCINSILGFKNSYAKSEYF